MRLGAALAHKCVPPKISLSSSIPSSREPNMGEDDPVARSAAPGGAWRRGVVRSGRGEAPPRRGWGGRPDREAAAVRAAGRRAAEHEAGCGTERQAMCGVRCARVWLRRVCVPSARLGEGMMEK